MQQIKIVFILQIFICVVTVLEGHGYFVLTATQKKQQISIPRVAVKADRLAFVFLYHLLGSPIPRPWKKPHPPPFLSDLKSLELQFRVSPIYVLLNE